MEESKAQRVHKVLIRVFIVLLLITCVRQGYFSTMSTLCEFGATDESLLNNIKFLYFVIFGFPTAIAAVVVAQELLALRGVTQKRARTISAISKRKKGA